MTEIVLLGMLNALCFWKKPVYVIVPTAMGDVIFGLIFSVSKNATPVYASTTFWEGMIVVILGLGLFLYEFVWQEVLKRIRG